MKALLCCLCVALFVAAVSACETILTAAEISADHARAVEFFSSAADSQKLGFHVSGVGDVNGDGFEDFAISAPYYGSNNVGAVYLVFGRSAAAWASEPFNLSAAIRISGDASESSLYLGLQGVAHGDFNGDGFSDILIGSELGKAFCAYGHNGTWSSFSTADIQNSAAFGFYVVGRSSNNKLFVGSAGDMNGDGIEDLLISDYNDASYCIPAVVFGAEGSNRSPFELAFVDGMNGFELDGFESPFAGNNIFSSPGDVNGDGLADLAVGDFSVLQSDGTAYIVFARNTVATAQQWVTPFDLGTLDGTNGFKVEGPPNSYLGYTITGAGDVNADGFADIFIGSYSASGGAWIVFGRAAPWTSPINASQLDGTNGFHFESSSDSFGCSGGGIGDINGDGVDDLVIGGKQALSSLGETSGVAAIIFGHPGEWSAEISRAEVAGSVGFLVDGTGPSSLFGQSARGAGDVNGDGLADFLVGAQNYESGVGYAVLVFGFDDHCAVCSNATEKCLVCKLGFILEGPLCTDKPAISSSSSAQQDTSSASASNAASGTAVVVIETGGGGTVGEVAAEVAQLLGVDVGQISVVEITPGTFEVTVINEEVAQQLVTLVTQCIEQF